MTSTKLSPVLFIPHGGGPMPLLNEPSHKHLTQFFSSAASSLKLGKPDAILVISAHWETDVPTVNTSDNPGLLYDYYGFPPASYQIKYPAPGSPSLAAQVIELLQQAGITAATDKNRPFDHGMFVPLKLIYPDADIPCVQLSLLNSLDPEQHIAIGKALAPLRKQNILILGSGMSFHNMQAFFNRTLNTEKRYLDFHHWLIDTCCNPDLTAQEREQKLIEWHQVTGGKFSHPREEHLLPLHVCYGAASVDSPCASLVFNEEVLHKKVAAFLW